MCESPIVKGRTGWRGWFDLPLRTARRPDEQWVDLTHPFSTSVPRSAMFPPPRFSYFAQMPEKPLNVTHMETIVHMGTHVDAPRHFYADGPGMDEIPIERMTGEGVVIRLDKSVNEQISVDDLVAATPANRTWRYCSHRHGLERALGNTRVESASISFVGSRSMADRT